MSAATAVTEATWEEQVIKAEGPVLVDFWAEWCGPCKIIAPVLEELATEYAGRATIVKLNVDENPSVARQFNIMSIPTMLVFKDGQPVDSLIGAHPKPNIKKLLDAAA